MDFRGVLRALRRHWWLVALAVVASVAAGLVLTAATTPQYATSVSFFVTTPSQGASDSYQGGLFSQQRVKSYADLLTGDRLARSIADAPGVGLTPAAVRSRIVARAVPDTVLLEATVTDPSAARSQRIAELLADRFVDLVARLETPAGSETPAVKVEVVAGPYVDPVPVTPRPARNLGLALALGLLVGAAAAVLRELLDVTIKKVETLAEIAKAPALGVVPFDAGATRSPLVVLSDPQSVRAEAFRHLRTNLQFVNVDDPVQTILLTSAVPNEGKSTTATNLAIAFAEAGRRTLLIEGDLRRPRAAEYLGLERAAGLSNVLTGQVDLDDVLQPWGRHGLQVLASGSVPPNPSELLGSRHMGNLMTRLRCRFDVVIIDAPPALPVTDAAVLATHADGVVLVTRYGKTPQARVQGALASLRAVEARILGCVLTMQPLKGRKDAYYYSYYREQPSPRRWLRRAAQPSAGSPAALPISEAESGTKRELKPTR